MFIIWTLNVERSTFNVQANLCVIHAQVSAYGEASLPPQIPALGMVPATPVAPVAVASLATRAISTDQEV